MPILAVCFSPCLTVVLVSGRLSLKEFSGVPTPLFLLVAPGPPGGVLLQPANATRAATAVKASKFFMSVPSLLSSRLGTSPGCRGHVRSRLAEGGMANDVPRCEGEKTSPKGRAVRRHQAGGSPPSL